MRALLRVGGGRQGLLSLASTQDGGEKSIVVQGRVRRLERVELARSAVLAEWKRLTLLLRWLARRGIGEGETLVAGSVVHVSAMSGRDSGVVQRDTGGIVQRGRVSNLGQDR